MKPFSVTDVDDPNASLGDFDTLPEAQKFAVELSQREETTFSVWSNERYPDVLDDLVCLVWNGRILVFQS